MKKFLMFLCTLMLVFGMVGSASALQYLDYDDTYVWMDETNNSRTWVFNLVNDDLSVGNIYDGCIINTATLLLRIEDDDDESSSFDIELEYADVNLDGQASYNNVEVDSRIYEVNVLSWISDYCLTVTIDDIQGDFAVTGMAVRGDYTPVPEPSTILLMGTGLLGLVGYGRKRKRFSKKS